MSHNYNYDIISLYAYIGSIGLFCLWTVRFSNTKDYYCKRVFVTRPSGFDCTKSIFFVQSQIKPYSVSADADRRRQMPGGFQIVYVNNEILPTCLDTFI